jgi:hypothetical protein
MDIGMLWFDSNHNQDVCARIERASTFYRSKYGRKPDLCYVHPSMLTGTIPKEVGGLKIRTSQTVLPNHFWLGIEDTEASKARSKIAA